MDFRLIESYHKVFETASVSDYAPIGAVKTVLLDDMLAFEGVLAAEKACTVFVKTECALPVTTRAVESVYVRHPVYPTITDPDYLNDKKPGRYPDLLLPLGENNALAVSPDVLTSLWFELKTTKDTAAGDYPVAVTIMDENGAALASASLTVHVIPAVLPKQTIKYTEWFHCDCLASYYTVAPLSERHWEIIENFARTAAENGQNMLYTPLFTPALDTVEGGERPTVQLVGVTREDGVYSFDFSLVDRWLAMCDRVGIEYIEVCHLFTQWGAAHAPKIMATVDGTYRRLFGWDTDSLSDEYIGFLRAFLVAFKDYMKKLGRLDKCMFHMSDEPVPQHLERFMKLKAAIADLLTDVPCGDAISHYEFYENGAVSNPIVAIDAITPFIEHKVPHLWGYYCCGEADKVSNRFIAMSMNRTRVIGQQIFKYELAGFLQWGYNFYYCCGSTHILDPYTCNDGTDHFAARHGIWVPAGDPFSVYPASDGTAYESLHIKGFTQALLDVRALQLLASLTSREEVVKLLDTLGNCDFTFADYCRDADFCERVRSEVNARIEAALK